MSNVFQFPGKWKGPPRAPSEQVTRGAAPEGPPRGEALPAHVDAPPEYRSALSRSLPPGSRFDDGERPLCPKCDGTGHVGAKPGETQLQWCPRCDGRGTVAPCPACLGRGNAVVGRPELGACAECSGSGAEAE